MILGALFSGFLEKALKVLTIVIPIPLFLVLILGAWVWIDKTSSVRKAVNQAVKELVAGAEIEAANARTAAQRRLRQMSEDALVEQIRRTQAAEEANQEFAKRLIESEIQNQDMENELEDLLSKPAPDTCTVEPGLLDRLRNK